MKLRLNIFAILRRLLAAVSLFAMTAVFFLPAAARWFGWLPRLQLVPAILAGAVLELIALAVLVALFGRLYCSVLCPLGILQDLWRFCLGWIAGRLGRVGQGQTSPVPRILRFAVLVIFLAGVCLGFTGLIEPYGIFGRFLAVGIRRVGEPATVTVVWALGLVAFILAMTFVRARWWCNRICPVGTFLGLFSRWSLFRVRIDAGACVTCGACAKRCDKGALAVRADKSISVDASSCVVCGNCLATCPKDALSFFRARKALSVFAGALVILGVGQACGADATGFSAADYADFRKELRAFYPDWGQGENDVVKDPRQRESYAKIERDLQDYVKAHPGFDALDLRQASYLSMRKHFVPFLFRTSPFYFEAGVNGGWGGKRPARIVNRLCSRFYKEKNLIPDEAFALKNARQGLSLTLVCGPFVDDMHHVPPFRTVLRKGFKGVRDEVAAALAKCPKNDPLGRKELETALVGLDTIHEIQLAFHREAQRQLDELNGALGDHALPAGGESGALGDHALPAGGESSVGRSPRDRRNLERIVEASARCPWEPPRTFFEGLNTLWFVREILGYVDGVNNFSLGRPDCYFIDLYKADLAAGRLTREEARELVAKFLITADCHGDVYKTLDSYNDHEMEIPMSVGGYDESGTWVYNELTDMFLDAHLGCDCVFPKMHCRISAKAPDAYLEKLGHMLMAGHAVFTLLNDDRYVPQYEREGFSPEDARAYVGCGCWNGFVDSVTDVDEANYLSLIKVLEMTVHRDPDAMRRTRLTLDPIDGAKSYAEVRETLYRNVIRFIRDVIGEYARYGRANAKVFPHPVYTMCLKGGIESRRDTTDAGLPPHARPKVMTLGFIGNVVDCLSSINHLCFVDKVCTLDELLVAVRSNWKGPRGEELRLRAMAAPSWGDNSPETNGEMAWWMNRISRDTEGMRSDQGGPIKFAIYTYREFMYWGLKTKATPDGRRNGDRLAQGFSPSEYRCQSDVTTVINAIGSFPHDLLYASNANLTFDRSAMNEKTLAAILRVYCRKGAHMIQPNCNSVEELLDAQKHPELHQNLIVRVCGFSARFVSLSKRWQDEVIARHRLK